MKKKDLLATYKRAAKQAHKREFEVGGDKIAVPRLTLGRQAQFELKVREHDPDFSLAKTRNRAAMAMAECVESVLKELREEGVPEKFEDDAQAQLWSSEFKARVLSKWGPYSDILFQPFTRRDMLYALTLAFQQEFGETIEDRGEEIPVDEGFVETVLNEAAPNTLETMFLWTVGLADLPEETSPEAAAESLDEIVEQVTGSPKASERPQKRKTTSTSSSPSSATTTDSASMKSGSST